MPSKSKKSRAVQESFLFVNENPSTLPTATKDAEADRNKQSHVQRRSFEKRQQERVQAELRMTERMNPSLPKHETPAIPSKVVTSSQFDLAHHPSEHYLNSVKIRTPLDSSDTRPEFRCDNPFPLHWDKVQKLEPLTTGKRTKQNEKPTQNHESRRRCLTASRGSLNRTLSTPSAVFQPTATMNKSMPSDTFVSLGASLAESAPPLMHFYTSVILPGFFNEDSNAIKMADIRHSEDIYEDMRVCMSDPAQLYGLLASTSALMFRRKDVIALPDLTAEHHRKLSLVFKTKAIEALRLKLASNKSDHATVALVHRLMAASFAFENYDAVETHYRGLLSLVDQLGGLATFNYYLMERMILLDLLYASKMGSRPRLEPLWDPGPYFHSSSSLIQALPANLLSSGHKLTAIANTEALKFHPKLIQAIHDIVETQKVSKWLSTMEQYRSAEYKWLAHRRLAIAHRLIVLKLQIQRQSHLDRPSPREMLPLLGLMMYNLATISAVAGAYVISEQLLLFAYYLQRLRTSQDSDDSDLILWSITVAGISAVGSNKNIIHTPSTRDLEAEAALRAISSAGKEMCAARGVTSALELRPVLEPFLYCNVFFGAQLEKFCKSYLDLNGRTSYEIPWR